MPSLKSSEMTDYTRCSIVCLLFLSLSFQVFKVNQFEFSLRSKMIYRYFRFVFEQQSAAENAFSWLIDEKYFILLAIKYQQTFSETIHYLLKCFNCFFIVILLVFLLSITLQESFFPLNRPMCFSWPTFYAATISHMSQS